MRRSIVLWLVSSAVAPLAVAHRVSDGLVNIVVSDGRATGEIKWAVRDLQSVISLDDNRDGRVTWGELRSRQSDLERYGAEHVRLSTGDGQCSLTWNELLVDKLSDGTYACLTFSAVCTAPMLETLTLHYSAIMHQDANHRGLIRFRAGEYEDFAVLSPARSELTFSWAAGTDEAKGRGFWHFVWQGMEHIYIGYDHMLFLLALLLPAIYRRSGRDLVPEESASKAFIEIVKIVTAFTVAHSITLAIVTLGWWTPPSSRLVESLIAFSVMVTALDNLFRFGRRSCGQAFAFGFGLIHGMGLASVLIDLGLAKTTLVLALIAFNVGVELAQLSLVGAVFPVIFGLRRTTFYRTVVYTGGGWLIAGVAAAWLIERAFALEFMPF